MNLAVLYSIYRQLSTNRQYFNIIVEVTIVISYEPFYVTLKKKNISTYKLVKDYNVSRSLLDRLKHNKPLSTVTIDDLCRILKCNVDEIMVYIENE